MMADSSRRSTVPGKRSGRDRQQASTGRVSGPGRLSTRRYKIDVDDAHRVSAEVRRPGHFAPGASPGLILAHGAGNDMHSPILTHLAGRLGRELLTTRFNFPYKESGRRAPDRAPLLEATYRAVIDRLERRDDLRPRPLVIGGKSMGGRIASHLAAVRDIPGDRIAGLLFLGYPLHPAGKPERLRDAHLGAIRCPMLFVQGSKDRLCDLTLLRATFRKLRAPHQLHVIDDGDHSFKVPKRTGRTEQDIFEEIGTVILSWLEGIG